ncbi:MAG: hypothetical protein AMQ74_00100 [Candidatus Methanofastidiosum methylothiophilum]|uniref:Uncharacterized protein n=1 Tax=Candidatus Methanofastidiosum methylothiophilum TaxID=1705564 RepID=A0A150JAG5_9EURY|nr:MAG: hypothetical protein AMQ74_00100 [Candidatus Methanofastidiosum methylthiophilus]NMC76084.1 hypothetical protein [Candidatus Methanofastidiosa archaeon]
MDNFDQPPRRRPKNTGLGRFIPFIVVGYILLTSLVGSFRLPSTSSSDPIYGFFFNSSIFIGGIIVTLILLASYFIYSKK